MTIKTLFNMCPCIYLVKIPVVYYTKYEKFGYIEKYVEEEEVEEFKNFVVEEFWPINEDCLRVTIKTDDIAKTNAEEIKYLDKFIKSSQLEDTYCQNIISKHNKASFFSILCWSYRPNKENYLSPEEEIEVFFEEIKKIEKTFVKKNHIVVFEHNLFFYCFSTRKSHEKQFEKFLKMGWSFDENTGIAYKYFE